MDRRARDNRARWHHGQGLPTYRCYLLASSGNLPLPIHPLKLYDGLLYEPLLSCGASSAIIRFHANFHPSLAVWTIRPCGTTLEAVSKRLNPLSRSPPPPKGPKACDGRRRQRRTVANNMFRANALALLPKIPQDVLTHLLPGCERRKDHNSYQSNESNDSLDRCLPAIFKASSSTTRDVGVSRLLVCSPAMISRRYALEVVLKETIIVAR